MAIQPPPAPTALQQGAPPASPKNRGCFGCGCGGCLVVLLLAVLLTAGGGYYFFVIQAQAAVAAPAALMVINQPVDVDQRPGIPGEMLNPGNTVHTGAGGHAGVKSPFALIQEIRQWFDGPVALSGAIATGGAVLAAQAMGADFGYIGSAFIATDEARASDAYKQAIVDGNSDEIVYSSLFTGVHGNYLKASIRAAGLDPDNLPESDPTKMSFGGDAAKAWKDIWGCGQGIGAITEVTSTAALVARLRREYEAARQRLC